LSDDPVLRIFLEDAKRLGITLYEYERRFGIILAPSGNLPSATGQRHRRHEVRGGMMSDADLDWARERERRRAIARRP
jgi:hypothetical protein